MATTPIQGDNNMTTTNGKLKGLCDGCETLSELQTDQYGLWLCKQCSEPYNPTITFGKDKITFDNIGI